VALYDPFNSRKRVNSSEKIRARSVQNLTKSLVILLNC